MYCKSKVLLCFFLCISFLVFSSNTTVKNSSEFGNHFHVIEMLSKNSEEISIDDEELLQKLRTALESIYKSNKLKFKEFSSDKSDKEITLKGIVEFYKEEIDVNTTFTTTGNLISLSGKLRPGEKLNNRKFKLLTKSAKGLADWFPKTLQKSIALDTISMAFDETSQKPTEINIAISAVNSWKVIKNGSLTFDNISGSLKVENPMTTKKATATLGGELKIGPTSITSTASVGNTKEAWTFDGALKDLSLTDIITSVAGTISGLPMPTDFVNVGVSNASFSIAPAAKTFTLNGTSSINNTDLGSLQLRVAPKPSSKKLGFMVGISPSSSFKMSSLDPNLKMLDDLGITNFGLVLSSYSAEKGNLDVFKKLGDDSSIGRGLNFIGAFDLSADGVNLDELIGVKSLMIRAVVSNNLSDLLLEGAINTNIKLSNAATFKKVVFRLKPAPSNFTISMGGQLEVKVDKDILLFGAQMAIDLSDQAFIITGTMDGMWNNPFGAQGISIGDLGAEVGLSFRTTPFPLPQMAIKGALKIKDFEGDLFVAINANNPSESAIDAGFNKVSLKAILEEFCDKQTLQKIPNGIRNTVLNISLEDVRLTAAARPLTIMGKDFDPGFRIKGTAAIGDIAGANLDVQVDYNGIDASAGIKKISHLPFFELKGARGMEDPMIRVIAKASTESKVEISGSATLLGLTAEAYMHLNDKGFDLEVNGKIFDAFQAKLLVEGSRIKDGGSFRVAATMKQDFMASFTKHASEEIDKATKKTQQDITKAQNTISKEQFKLKSLNVNIANMRNTVRAERKRDLDNIRNARQAIVNEKRSHFNDIANNIKSIQRKINAAHAGIARKKKEIANASALEKPVLSLKYAPYFTEQAFIISTQETAKVAQLGYKETANLALIAAEESVGLVHTLGSKTPIDADPRIVALFTARETANASMEAAKGILEAGKIIGVGTLQASKWIVENGPASVVNITYAHFEGALSGTHGGSVTLHIKGTFAGNPMDERLTFNFSNPITEMEKFAKSLL